MLHEQIHSLSLDMIMSIEPVCTVISYMLCQIRYHSHLWDRRSTGQL